MVLWDDGLAVFVLFEEGKLDIEHCALAIISVAGNLSHMRLDGGGSYG